MENKQLTLGSLFDGSGGFPLGGLLTGQITPLWSSEVEPFAIRVTTKRLPQVKHYATVSGYSLSGSGASAHRLESKNPISEADLEWIFARNYEGTE